MSSSRGMIREALAKLAHDGIWSTWMRYMFSRCIRNEDGSMTIPVFFVERWHQQIATPYDDLPEEMKPSDREQADKILAVLDACNEPAPVETKVYKGGADVRTFFNEDKS